MKESPEFGMNKTPTQLHPIMTKNMVEGYSEFPPHAEDTSKEAFDLRKDYIENSGQLGSVPMPATFRGAVSTGAQALKGNSPSVLTDKLGERLAYERSGVRLYDAFLTKCKAALPNLDTTLLEQIRNEEAEHFALVRNCIVAMGGDPTAQTPCADASAMAAMGLMQLINDPRSSIPQCLQAVLMAELTDVAAWDLLIKIAEDAGLDNFAKEFAGAKLAEDRHLEIVKTWLEKITLENEVVQVPSMA